MKKREDIELLAPAGSFEALVAAVQNGANAIYLGGQKFGARAFAHNFDYAALKEAVDYCHLRNVKLYVTVNTLYNNAEIDEIFDYLKYQFQESSFIEDNYVFPKKVKMTFPDKKRNLIYIYLESMESTYMDIKNGGGYEVNYIPQLTKIANNNISFSNTDAFGGAYTAGATGWTIGAMVAHSSGLPLKSPFSGNLLYNYYEQILPGAYTLGEILHDNGYNNYIMFGSDATFAGRDIYYKNHGQYKIYDYYTAIEDGVIDDDYFVFWGYEDEKLFSYAKRELKKISKNKEPFNFTLLTVDTHAMDGYTSDFCKNEYDNKYLNSIACSSYQVNNFISWIKKQDFYKDTTIVLVGDHLSMNNYSFNNLPAHYNRTVYNAFINTNVKPINEKERIFSTMDFFPTTLASLGVYIDGDRLGLGTNLFSDKHTLLEEYNYSYVNTELNKKVKNPKGGRVFEK
mgnify:CR=1 FL=1